MRTLKVCVNCIPKKIPIGHVGENVVEAIQFDYSEWKTTCGEGTLNMVLQRSPDAIPYAVDMTDADGLYIVTSTDLEYQGSVRAQLVYNVTGNPVPVKKSDVFLLGVDVSLGDAGDIPDPWQSWLDRVLQASDQAQEAVEHYPKVENGYWYVWNVSTESWTNTGQKAQGEQGVPGVGISSTVLNPDYTLTITFTDGSSYTTPPIRGEKGDTGNGISSTVLNPDYTLTITFTDGTTYTTPSIRGIPGQDYVITSADYDEIASRVDTMIAGERQAALDDIDDAKDDAVADVADEGTTQVGLVTSEGTTQVGLVTAKGQEVLESIPEDYSELSDDVSELKSDFTHKEDWVVGNAEQLLSDKYTEDSEPYVFRKSVSDDREFDEIIGGTIAWNQKINGFSFSSPHTVSGITFTDNNDGSISVNGTAEDLVAMYIVNPNSALWTINHKYILIGCPSGGSQQTFSLAMRGQVGDSVDYGNGAIWNPETYIYKGVAIYVRQGMVMNHVFKPQVFDITQMFGSTIADYIYSLEQTTEGAGVALFRSLFPKPYYEYNAGELKSITGLVSHDTVGFNQWDEEWEVGILNGAGVPSTASNAIRSKNYSPCVGGETYYATCGKTDGGGQNRYYLAVFFYDADKNFISYTYTNNLTIIAPTNARYFKIGTNTSTVVYGNTYNHDICINIFDPTKNGTYEPYVKRSYPLDDSLTLRGIPKLDSSNNLYYDGDAYASDGTVTRKYGIVDLGTLTWNYDGRFYATLTQSEQTYQKQTQNAICNRYQWSNVYNNGNGTFYISENHNLSIWDSSYTDAATFKAAMSGVYLVYELATPTTENAEPFQSLQICSEHGTEEYVYDSEAFPIPVGHITKYPDNLRKKLDGLPWDLSMIAPVETGTKASQAYAIGKYFLLNNQFCKAKTAIASGATFTLNTNYEVTTIADELYTALH